MDVIDEVKARLAKYPDVRYSESADSIEVQPSDESGFAVGLRVREGGLTVYFDGWHEEFESEKDALNCFAFGLSKACRLCVVYRGPTPVRWYMEAWEDGFWVQDSEVGSLLVPFWRPKRVVHKQNDLIPLG